MQSDFYDRRDYTDMRIQSWFYSEALNTNTQMFQPLLSPWSPRWAWQVAHAPPRAAWTAVPHCSAEGESGHRPSSCPLMQVEREWQTRYTAKEKSKQRESENGRIRYEKEVQHITHIIAPHLVSYKSHMVLFHIQNIILFVRTFIHQAFLLQKHDRYLTISPVCLNHQPCLCFALAFWWWDSRACARRLCSCWCLTSPISFLLSSSLSLFSWLRVVWSCRRAVAACCLLHSPT